MSFRSTEGQQALRVTHSIGLDIPSAFVSHRCAVRWAVPTPVKFVSLVYKTFIFGFLDLEEGLAQSAHIIQCTALKSGLFNPSMFIFVGYPLQQDWEVVQFNNLGLVNRIYSPRGTWHIGYLW